MSRAHLGRLVVFVLLGAVVLPACRKKAPPPAPAAQAVNAPAAYACPPSAAIASALGGAGRTVRVGCHAYAVGRFFLAGALGTDAAGANPKLELAAGGSSDKLMVFEIVPGVAPKAADALASLVRDSESVAVRVQPGEGEGSLLRVGVVGQAKGGKSTELVFLVQLVAHHAPKLLWVGPGDVGTTEGGCVIERRVTFQMLFGRLDMIVSERGRPAPGAKPPEGGCGGGPGMQESLPSRGVELPAGRSVPFQAPA